MTVIGLPNPTAEDPGSPSRDLSEEVRRLMIEEHLSNTSVAERLGIAPSDVMALMRGRSGMARGTESSRLLESEDGDCEQVQKLRRLARSTLLDKVPNLPPGPLVRVWQLVEDPRLLEGGFEEAEDPFDVPGEVREKVFGLLDGI